MCGTALPVCAATADNLPLHWALEQARPGEVLVVDAGGSRCGFWGRFCRSRRRRAEYGD